MSPYGRTALVHDWLPLVGGAERVVEQMIGVLGPVDVYTLFDFLSDEDRGFLGGSPVFTSSLGRWPGVRRYYRHLFPFCPYAIEQFDVSAYDTVVSSSAAFAKGVICAPEQLHVAYLHTPVRYAWDQTFDYLADSRWARFPTGALLRYLLHRMRVWDVRTGPGPDLMIANSTYVRARIRRVYGRDAVVIHPPVDVAALAPQADKDDVFVTASRLVPYKRFDLLVEAFRAMPGRRLEIIGDGPERRRLEASRPPNVTFLGHVPRAELIRRVARARAFLFAGLEDFGIVMAEAQALGTPVIAFARGGAADIVRPLGSTAGPSGLLFEEQSAAAVVAAIDRFEAARREITAAACAENAQRFSQARFREAFRTAITLAREEKAAFETGARILTGEGRTQALAARRRA